MTIETVDDLCESLADMIGVYGACKSEDEDGCEYPSDTCCRIGFCLVMKDRINKAVENTAKLASIDFNH